MAINYIHRVAISNGLVIVRKRLHEYVDTTLEFVGWGRIERSLPNKVCILHISGLDQHLVLDTS